MDCHVCRSEERFDTLPPRERVDADEQWRVVHAFDSRLPGWLVLVPRRHVTSIAELTDTEAASLGTWQVRLSRALTAVTGCVKTYVMQYAEQAGFAHVQPILVRKCPWNGGFGPRSQETNEPRAIHRPGLVACLGQLQPLVEPQPSQT
ncbi:HIT family protein [Verrucosispora sp. WMMD703]|uniref:HIT family protein n=1 Tax=Verrucosispora sp. WMMD703 TaxID=3403463 RepID=UPI003B92C2AD